MERRRTLGIDEFYVDVKDTTLEPFGVLEAGRIFASKADRFIARFTEALELIQEKLGGPCPGEGSPSVDVSQLSYNVVMRLKYNLHAACRISEPSVAAYVAIMLTILEQFYVIKGKTLRIASFGAGPAIYELILATILRDKRIPYEMVCVDIADGMIELRKKIRGVLKQWKPQRFKFQKPAFQEVTGNIEGTTLPSSSLDVIYCLDSIHMVQSRIQVIEEMKRVLDPNGLGLAVFVAYQDTWDTRRGCRLDELLDELEIRGFEVQFVRSMRGGPATGTLGKGKMEQVYVAVQLFRERAKMSLSWRAKLDPAELSAIDGDNLSLSDMLMGL